VELTLSSVDERPVMAKPVVLALPKVPLEAKRLVELAVVEKNEVVVAEVPVPLRKVKFWRVDEPVTNREERVTIPLASIPKAATDEVA
jgi:hypothetical protein